MTQVATRNTKGIFLFLYNEEEILIKKSLAKERLIYKLYKDKYGFYGIFACLKISGETEYAKVDEVSNNIFEAKRLFEFIYENMVLPHLLKEVVAEYQLQKSY